MLCLETFESARRRQADVYAEIVGYGSSNDGADLFRPSGQGLRSAIRLACDEARQRGLRSLDYVNAHGTGTRLGDQTEIAVLHELFGTDGPAVSSTKALGGHALGAAGGLEAVHSLIMLEHGFLAPTCNLLNVASECSGVPHVRQFCEKAIGAAMTFSVGLGGTNSCLIFQKC